MVDGSNGIALWHSKLSLGFFSPTRLIYLGLPRSSEILKIPTKWLQCGLIRGALYWAEIFSLGLWLMEHSDQLIEKYFLKPLILITWAIIGESPYPPDALPTTVGYKGWGSQWGGWFNVSDHLSVIFFWKALDPSNHWVLNFGQLSQTQLNLA